MPIPQEKRTYAGRNQKPGFFVNLCLPNQQFFRETRFLCVNPGKDDSCGVGVSPAQEIDKKLSFLPLHSLRVERFYYLLAGRLSTSSLQRNGISRKTTGN
ncbi:MAG TPA: hypothetical protein DCY88_22555 [Cyanobacteria bacterium UBA11372]|nr:hypothetical protein [Cyanobacteria bacterium UBA11372]